MANLCMTRVLLVLGLLLSGSGTSLAAPDLTNTDALYRLAQQYQSGTGKPQNLQQAATWLLVAASQGHREAQFELGSAYHNGSGLPQLDKRAVYWWRKAAEQGHPGAQYRLGRALLTGQGTATDADAGRALLLKAEQQGYTLSAEDLKSPEKPLPTTQASPSPSESNKENTLDPAELAVEPKTPVPQMKPAPETFDPIPVVETSESPEQPTKTVTNTDTETVAPALRGECLSWLTQAPDKGFTIQLIATHRLSSVMTYIERHELEGNYSLCAYDEYNSLWFAIFYGHYDSLRAARAALNELSDSLKRSKPYFRNLSKMRQLVRANNRVDEIAR